MKERFIPMILMKPWMELDFQYWPSRDAVYFTCIPALRRLTDPNEDGIADTNEKIGQWFRGSDLFHRA